MHGNVAEWALDQYDPGFYTRPLPADGVVKNPYNVPKTLYPRSVRGGSWDQPAAELRSAARIGQHERLEGPGPRRSRSRSGTTPTPCTSASASSARSTEPTEEEKLAQQLIPRPEDVPEWGLREGFVHD